VLCDQQQCWFLDSVLFLDSRVQSTGVVVVVDVVDVVVVAIWNVLFPSIWCCCVVLCCFDDASFFGCCCFCSCSFLPSPFSYVRCCTTVLTPSDTCPPTTSVLPTGWLVTENTCGRNSVVFWVDDLFPHPSQNPAQEGMHAVLFSLSVPYCVDCTAVLAHPETQGGRCEFGARVFTLLVLLMLLLLLLVLSKKLIFVSLPFYSMDD